MRLLHFHFRNQNRPLKGTAAKRDVCRGSSVTSGTKFPVALVQSASMCIISLNIIVLYFVFLFFFPRFFLVFVFCLLYCELNSYNKVHTRCIKNTLQPDENSAETFSHYTLELLAYKRVTCIVST